MGIECRNDDDDVHTIIKPLNDSLTARCVNSERHVTALLGGNCHVPVAVYCMQLPDSELLLRARVASADGRTLIADSRRGHQQDAMEMGEQCAQALLANGAAKLIAGL